MLRARIVSTESRYLRVSLFTRVDGCSFFDEGLHPTEDTLPSLAMVLGGVGVAGKTAVMDFNEGSRACFAWAPGVQAVDALRLELPTHNGFERGVETWNPGMNEEAGRIDFEVLALHAKLLAVDADADARPFATGDEIGLALGEAIHFLLAPPLGHLARVADG